MISGHCFLPLLLSVPFLFSKLIMPLRSCLSGHILIFAETKEKESDTFFIRQAKHYSRKHFCSAGRGVQDAESRKPPPSFSDVFVERSKAMERKTTEGRTERRRRRESQKTGTTERRHRSRGLPRTLFSKVNHLLSSCCLLILLICFPGFYDMTALPEKTVDAASRDAISRHRLDHIPRWMPSKVH
jgi:hypothetical protein